MGLFDSLSKMAKDVVKDVAKDVVKDVINGTNGSNTNSTQQTVHYSQNQQTTQPVEIKSFDFQPVAVNNVTIHGVQNYIPDDSDRVLVQTYGIYNEYHKVQVYGSEITDAYMYYPQGSDEEYIEQEDFQIPYIYIGFEANSDDLIDKYLTNGQVKPGCTIEKVNNSFIEYRTRCKLADQGGDLCFLSYNFHTQTESSYYNQIGISYPYRYVGTQEELQFINVLDQVASSYSEHIEDGWNNEIN